MAEVHRLVHSHLNLQLLHCLRQLQTLMIMEDGSKGGSRVMQWLSDMVLVVERA
jgi:hypothetical protein